jgi:hybrid cluster-associated redox disulfide protein
MNKNDKFQAHMTVETVLQKWPETWVVFKAQKTDCVGCSMQRFCTLQEVADIYQLSLANLLAELETCVNSSKSLQRSTP